MKNWMIRAGEHYIFVWHIEQVIIQESGVAVWFTSGGCLTLEGNHAEQLKRALGITPATEKVA
jgi:hypothetical protein